MTVISNDDLNAFFRDLLMKMGFGVKMRMTTSMMTALSMMMRSTSKLLGVREVAKACKTGATANMIYGIAL